MSEYRHFRIGESLNSFRASGNMLLYKIAKRANRDKLADASLKRAWRANHGTDTEIASKYGSLALSRGETSKATEAFSLAVDADPENATALYKLGFAFERGKEWEAAESAYRRAQLALPDAGHIAFRRGRCLAELHHDEEAVAQFRIAIRSGHRTADAYSAIYSAEANLPLWKRLETLRAGTQHHSENHVWLRDRAVLAAQMSEHAEAIKYFEAADSLSTLNLAHKIDLARSYQALGLTAEAEGLLRDLAKNDKGAARELGPGAFFRDRGYWSEAIDLFKLKLSNTSSNHERARLEFEIGHAYDRQYLWHEAQEWFEKSLLSDGRQSYRHYRLGVVFERLKQYEHAIGPYAKALQISPDKLHWYYRLAVCARKSGRNKQALWAFRCSLGGHKYERPDAETANTAGTVESIIDELSAEYAHDLLDKRLDTYPAFLESWRAALEETSTDNVEFRLAVYRQLAMRSNHLSQSEVLDYVDLLLTQGASEDEVLTLLESTRDVRLPDGLDLKKYLNRTETRRRSLYAEYQVSLALSERYVLLESNHGSSLGCHPLALFREMSADQRFAGFTFVWAHKPNAMIPDEISTRRDVILVELHSDLYLKYLATCKYLINNVSFGPYFVRREGQIYLNTWHGTPLKTLGRSMRQGLLEYENLARNFVQATHVASPNELTEWALFDDHGISRYATAAKRVTGSARLDRLINEGETLRRVIRGQLRVEAKTTMVLYAPTWRGGVSDQEFDVSRLKEDLEAISSIPDTQVFFRAHRLTEKLVSKHQLPAQVVPAEVDTNDLLAAVDILVTDYSSIGFDFLPTGRPVVYYVPDFDEYSSNRGLYLDPSNFPGKVCFTREQLISTLSDPRKLAAVEEAVREKYVGLEDGAAAHRVLNFMLEEVDEVARHRPLLVFHASLIPNGIASALLALLYSLDPTEVDIVLVVEAGVMRREEGRQAILERLPDYVDLAFRIDNITATPEEQWAINRDSTHDVGPSQQIDSLRSRAWRRETRRVLGPVVPGAAIEFDGYASLWADFISSVGDESTRHLIWQHNQLVDEWRTKYPELGDLFRRYEKFDAIIPVAESLAAENRREMGRSGFETSTPYFPVPNVLDSRRIKSLSNKTLPTELGEWFNGRYRHVVSIGRLSPEKNYGQLIDAWPEIAKRVPNARLTIIGSGLLEAEYKARVIDLGISGSVKFTGQLKNPYPALRKSDLFVLPSTHEGQPVVLLEAMTLGVPVAAAHTPGSTELIEYGYGKTIGHTAKELADAILSLLDDGSSAAGKFNADQYRENAIGAFWTAVASES